MEISFYKYHGLGNDYLVYDSCKNNTQLTKEAIKKICHRNFGLGSDGILVGPLMAGNTIGVKIFNPDGSEAEKSGNGVRIFAKYLKDAGYVTAESFTLYTLGGEVSIRYNNEMGTNMTVFMGKLSFDREVIGCVHTPKETIDIPLEFYKKVYQCTCVSIGNPHCVIPMEEISRELVCEIGKYSERAEYFPDRINTQIVKVMDRQNIQIEIFERGAGYTLASGSSSCAAAGAVYRLGLVGKCVCVHMPGGQLQIEIDKDYNVSMTGEVASIGKMTLSKEFIFENMEIKLT